jgi:hypothetical protein
MIERVVVIEQPAPQPVDAGIVNEIVDAGTPTVATPVVAPKPVVKRAVEAPALKRVILRAPSSVAWQTRAGDALGRGTTQVDVDANSTRLIAYDKSKALRVEVPIVGGEASFNALPSGTLAVQTNLFADVSIGEQNLGRTPFRPKTLTVGTYEVKLISPSGEIVMKTATVRDGETTTLKVRLER